MKKVNMRSFEWLQDDLTVENVEIHNSPVGSHNYDLIGENNKIVGLLSATTEDELARKVMAFCEKTIRRCGQINKGEIRYILTQVREI